MQLNGTEHKIAMETRGSLMKNLYIPTAGAQCNYNRGETGTVNYIFIAMSRRLCFSPSGFRNFVKIFFIVSLVSNI